MDEQRAWLRSRRKKRLRVLAAALGFFFFFSSYPNILETLSALAAESEEGEEGSYVITSFAPLDEETKEQTVSVGTDMESLYLPDTLEAVVRFGDEKIERGEESSEDSEQEDEEENPNDSTGEGDTDIEENPDSGENAGGNGDSEGKEDADGNGDSENGEDADGNGDSENGEDAGENGESGDGEGAGESGESGDGEDAGESGESGDGEDTGESGESGDGEDAGESSDSEAGKDSDGEEKSDDSADNEDSGAKQSDSTKDEARAGSAIQESSDLTVQTDLFVLPVYAAENEQDDLEVKTLYETSESQEDFASTETDEEAVSIEGITWESSPSYDSETAGEYVFTPVLPEGYVLSEDVTLPQITVTVEASEEFQAVTVAGELLAKILSDYFDGLLEDEIYDAILAMDEDTRLSLTADYEAMLAAMTQEDAADERLQIIVSEIERGIADAVAKMPVKAPVFLKARTDAPRSSGSIPLRRISGDGNAFVYHSFKETKSFTAGETYAFLNGIYGYEDAVSVLGSGAILKATTIENGSYNYIRYRYGESATVKKYVNVITRGKDFDRCVIGGLYQVPDSGTPTEYRYFCGFGGARNCGPYYAYTYVKESLTAADVSASLNDIEKQGSTDPMDYTVSVAFGGNRSMTLDAGSYTVQIPDPDSDEIIIIVSDSEGNNINTKFRIPLVVNYDGNGTGVSNLPKIQPAWTGESVTISSMTPIRSGYSFVNWKEAQKGTTYTKGQRIASFGSTSLLLKAQWKDTQAPDFTYSKSQVMIRATADEVKQAVEESLVITDNEPVSECTVTVTAPANITRTIGDKDVTITVRDKAGNTTTKTVKVEVISLSLLIDTPEFTESTKTLSAVLASPGGDTITETGFVWGIMSSPSMTLNNGKKTTTSPVTEANGEISVAVDNIQKGVNYYARAYAVAGGVTYYSNEIIFGIGTPKYGSFTIEHKDGPRFTVTRSGGSEGEQKVYYRTVNGSAVGGTHFTHQASSLTFAAGETSKTFTVSEYTANWAYTGKPATAYTNANRIYSVELYRVTGGGTLGDMVRASRTMRAESGYKVDRNVYTTEKSIVNVAEVNTTYGQRIADTTGGQGGTKENVSFLTNRYNEINYNTSTSFTSYYKDANEVKYLKNTASGWYYRYDLYAYEYDDGYEHVYMGTKALADTNYSLSATDAAVSGVSGQLWACNFLQGQKDAALHYYFPDTRTGGGESGGYPRNSNGRAYAYNGKTYVDLKVDDTCYVYFGATGADKDIWYVDGLTSYAVVHDKNEPKMVAVAPMAGGLYKAGDTFTVSLIFDEIVDSANSSLSSVNVETTWGEARYTGGADTNVLYFTGSVKAGASGTLNVTKVNNAGNIKDMCNTNGNACPGGSGNTTASANTAQSNFTLTSKGVANGIGTVNIAVNDNKANTNSLRYVWSDSTTMPVTGWVDTSSSELTAAKGTSGLSVSVRKEPGSGSSNGKWYLHVIGTYDTTGATTYKYAEVDFGTPQSPTAPAAPAPTFVVSANNSVWATSRNINLTTANASGGTLQYRKAGTSSWKTLSVSSSAVTVTENGWYTFQLSSKNKEYIITKDIQVEKIDRNNPTGAVGARLESGTNQTTKAGVYTKITLPVTFSDSQSGVKSVQYAWTNTTGTPAASTWKSLTASQVQAGKAELSYTASESTETTKYLHIKVTDQVSHTYTARSAGYTVISQAAINSHAPKITLTGAPTKWTNDMATLEWSLTDYAGKNYEVILPDGKKAKTNANSGETWAPRNGIYTVKVRDLDYGGENTATVNVQYIDTTAPVVNVSGVSDSWQGSNQIVTFSANDSQSGVGKKYIKIVTSNEEIPTEGLTELTSSNTVSVNGNGVWYVYYKYYDQAGDDSVGRESNKTEGFAGPIRIDTAEPVLTAIYKTVGVPKNEGLPISVKATYGMSGGNVEVNSEEIAALTAEPGDADGEINRETDYKVMEKGTYRFDLTSGSGKTVAKSLTVYEAVFVSGTEAAAASQLAAANATLVKPDDPQRAGYAFKGWYTAESGGNEWDFDTDQVTADLTLYAQWRDETGPDAPVLQKNIVLPTGWTNAQKTIPLTLHDGVGVEQLWVSIDGGKYQKVNDFTGSDGDAPCHYEYKEVVEGAHTYRFKAVDAAGNESLESKEFKVMLDNTKPVIGTLTYENKEANLWQYIIGKKSLIIHVPVTDAGSGVERISYTMTPEDASGNPDSSKARTKTASVENGKAQITFSENFRGTITITCADAAGNGADSVTVDTSQTVKGVIVEDHAPDIATDLKEDSYYDDVPAVRVTVKDDTAQAITTGLAEVTYKVGGSAQKPVTVDTSALKAEISFTIPASEISAGITTIRITAKDNAGNETTKNVTVRIKGREATPTASVNYVTEKLKDLVPNREYLINGTSCRADKAGFLPIPEKWLGTTISIVKRGNGKETTDSEKQDLVIPVRPQKPAPTGVDVSTPGGTGKLTGLNANTDYEVSVDNGKTWEAHSTNGSGEITGLDPGSYVVRVKAGISNFASKNSAAAKIGAYRIKVTFQANGEEYRVISVDYGGTLSAIPAVPPKKDAGDQIFAGEWCADEQGNRPAVFTNITADMTVYAFYSTGYIVTLQSGTGYTLAAQPGSISPVKEGGSFRFGVAINSGYEKTNSFAVSVNGKTIMPAADGVYTIANIMENKVVTASGVQKKEDADNGTDTADDSDEDDDKKSDRITETENGGDSGDGTDPGGSTNPGGGTTSGGSITSPNSDVNPADETAPGEATGPDDKKKSTDKTGAKESEKPDGADRAADKDNGADTENGKKPGENQHAKGQSGTVEPHTVVDDKIVPKTPIKPVTVGKTEKTAAIPVDEGMVIVTVNNVDESLCTAQAADAVAVANAVLSKQQTAQVSQGETIEIRIDVERIDSAVSQEDRELTEQGVEELRGRIPNLEIGMYVDISMYVRVGASEWNAVRETGEPIEIIIDVPEELQAHAAELYVVRTHEGAFTLLEDLDDKAETITIQTSMFSVYAIAYAAEDGTLANGKCSLCHICPTFLGICYFIWLAVIVAAVIIVVLLLRRRKKEENENVGGEA